MLTADELHVLYEGIKLNNVHHYDYVLTGETHTQKEVKASGSSASRLGMVVSLHQVFIYDWLDCLVHVHC